MEKASKIAQIAAFVSTAVAVITLALNLWGLRRDMKQQLTRDWQETVIFSIVSETGREGLSLDSIRDKYKNAAADLPDELPKTELQTPALKRIMLSLLSKRIISVRPNGNYGVTFDPTPPAAMRMIDDMERMRRVSDDALMIVRTDSGKLTFDQLITRLRQKHSNVTEEEFSNILSSMMAAGVFKMDSEGRVLSVLGRP